MANPVYIVCILVLLTWLTAFAVIKSGTLDKLLRNVLYNLIGIALGLMIYSILAPFAYQERGYFAIGGEGLWGYMIAWFVGPVLIWNHDTIAHWFKKTSQSARDSRRLRRG